MSDDAPTPEVPDDLPRGLPTPGGVLPLHMPAGSVRALITLGILGTVWAQILLEHTEVEALRVTLLLVLGYYFGARAGLTRADAYAAPAEDTRHPLWLPKGSIRLLIIGGFAAVAYQLHKEERLFDDPHPALILVATFIGGAMAKGLVRTLASGFWEGGASRIMHGVAGVTLAIVYGFCACVLLEVELPARATEVFLGVVGFYLGKR